jgi:7,8-dihydro-6-hydroxymethylpterin dimethyltransferase
MEKTCPAHGPQSVTLSDDVDWYERTRAIVPTKNPPSLARHGKAVHHGCPFDCGPCEAHEQKVRLPVVTITSACNLDCPICYVHNKNDDAFHMREEAFRAAIAGLDNDILNITGGEPTLHPQFLDFLQIAKETGFHRVTVCTNGIKIVKDPAVAPRLAEIGARVALSFDTFEEDADVLLQGAKLFDLKMQCLDILEAHGVDTTLIPVMTRGVNDHEIGKIVDVLLTRPNIRHIEVHTMTFTGQSGTTFDRGGRISIREVVQRIEEQTAGLLRIDDFIPSPCAHPLCYQIAYLLLDPDGGPPVPFTRFLTRDEIYEALSDRLYLEPTPKLEAVFRAAIDRLWTEEPPDHERMLRLIKRVLDDTSLKATERAIKAIYVHSHMDEETFDVERAAQCCDSNCYADGSTIPVCNYNVLYREKETLFNHRPREWNERTGGKKSLPVVHA